ncbi:hypothetical protein F5X99DRAFT_411531 [Biscogniauxia marginata]|nr:hypothetical protein F5X99DRAFT_411531 [Biscogniauxia marginata]
MAWNMLPAELKLMILQSISTDLSTCAAVCKEWQAIVEKATFNELELLSNPTDLDLFEQVFGNNIRRQACLRYLWFRVKLPTYGRFLRYTVETPEQADAARITFSQAILRLLNILHGWDSDKIFKSNPSGLHLELSAHSPSDIANMSGEENWTWNYVEWGIRFFDLSFDLERNPLGFYGLPRVEVVTGFSVLRRNLRRIDHNSLYAILSNLPRLTEIHLEPWHQPWKDEQEFDDEELAGDIPTWPTSLKKINVFQHCETFEEFENGDVAWGSREKCAELGIHIAWRSCQLEELNVCNWIDAQHFFKPFSHPQAWSRRHNWENLRHLTLTTCLITENADNGSLNGLLRTAAKAAMRMPVVHSIKIYNTTNGDTGIFQYIVSNAEATVRWASTWSFFLQKSVRASWAQVARRYRLALAFQHEELLEDYEDPATFVHSQLVTRALVLHPSSTADLMGDKTYDDPLEKLRFRPRAPDEMQEALAKQAFWNAEINAESEKHTKD